MSARLLSHNERLKQLEEAVSWVTTLVKVPNGSRFPAYINIWRALTDRADLPNGGVSEAVVNAIIDDFGAMEYRGAVHEAYELVFIHQAFSGNSALVPTQLLEKAVSGGFSEIEESPQTGGGASAARNFLFELTVAARLQRAGINVVLDADADIEFNFRTNRVFVECKRLSSYGAFERNFRKGTEQLLNRFKKFGYPKNHLNCKPVGLLFFAMTKSLNPRQAFLSAPNVEAARELIRSETLRMLKAKEHLLAEKLHKNIAVMGFYTHVQMHLPHDFGSYTYWDLYPFHNLDSKIGRVGRAVVDKITGSV